jgi:hypothetical protein
MVDERRREEGGERASCSDTRLYASHDLKLPQAAQHLDHAVHADEQCTCTVGQLVLHPRVDRLFLLRWWCVGHNERLRAAA